MNKEKYTTSPQVRSHLIEVLELDLIGPTPQNQDYAEEILDQPPSKYYLTGFLVPHGVPISQRSDDSSDDDIDLISDKISSEDENIPEKTFAKKAYFPSSIGLSFLLQENVNFLDVTIQWGDYLELKHNPTPTENHLNEKETTSSDKQPPNTHHQKPVNLSGSWKRIPREAKIPVSLTELFSNYNQLPKIIPIPDTDGLQLVVSLRPVSNNNLIPPGTGSVSVFLVNNRFSTPENNKDTTYTFQTCLTIHTPQPLVPRPNLRGGNNEDWDENVADLQYRHDYEYAVGHNVSVIALTDTNGNCQQVSTAWIPKADVEKVIPTQVNNVELNMEALAHASTPQALQKMLFPLVDAYNQWIAQQTSEFSTQSTGQDETFNLLIRNCQIANQRIHAGILALQDPQIFTAFSMANKAIATAIRQRNTHNKNITPSSVAPPQWRLFQLAFLLMNLVGIAQGESSHRPVVDLLFFPTGGGKTEAYLGIAAFTLVLRRLRYPGVKSAGVSVLMRYTLRLLTLDQLGRGATMICALELERRKNPQQLGTWPFEIGLWVGEKATPNRMGQAGERNENSARERTIAFQHDNSTKAPSPIPIENCPWCGTKLKPICFQLKPTPQRPINLEITCCNRSCDFHGDSSLPIVAVDEVIYRRLPCFIISTVDKFAMLPWVGETGTLFGKVDRHDQDGFYGPTQLNKGKPLGNYLPPPDLIIQDELHLISGPLGTMVGLYETAIDALSTQQKNNHKILPKIIASTATVRRANKQIQALFGRNEVSIFPPPGPDRRDSFFAKTVPITEKNGRTYVGIAAQGRSAKVVLLRTYLALLGAAQKQWLNLGGNKNPENPADPYMTLLGYFNSLQELGGSRRIVEDEVKSRLAYHSRRRRVNETSGLFADREIDDEPEELTSRITTNQIANTKRRMELTFSQEEKIDVVLATNMISVGLDITRLGLMVVLGQPKTAAEYIQATSRVGRDDQKPGLVITLLNIHRPRDRSHYERFCAWHATFYRDVEASSVTPFSPRAIDRGLAAITVALARLGHPGMTAPTHAFNITKYRQELNFVIDTIAQRAQLCKNQENDSEQTRQKVAARVKELLDLWNSTADEKNRLQYQREVGEAPPLIFNPLDPELDNQPPEIKKRFKAQRSLRDVEPMVNLRLINFHGQEIEESQT
ncbi:DISARM system helicase DrmA [Umezakia ovalisporum]|uniref:DISARM system helicase DrmA n=1 Tax=Umezakia ovalisporum FSS-62 TaxID=2971776 RepID=A0AA43KEN4_9CYAN|nr:DISARM system helicase DrmA [Umezakia ovalisporum]MDH6063806.1 DISARM system helicase DrmA [Umezakia ovalisporum FSS-62]